MIDVFVGLSIVNENPDTELPQWSMFPGVVVCLFVLLVFSPSSSFTESQIRLSKDQHVAVGNHHLQLSSLTNFT